jgi:predicted aconitase with swiveling domain
MNHGAAMRGIKLEVLVSGEATGPLLKLEESISFWGGLDPQSGKIIDVQHPDKGQCIKDTILMLPGIRGSTAASGALLECIHAGCGPSAIILAESDPTPMIAILVAQHIGLEAIPVYSLRHAGDMNTLKSGRLVVIRDGQLT